MNTAALLAGGVLLLVAGAELLVRSASRLAAAAGVPSLVIGLTVVAFGTSAPELAVSVGAALDGESGIAVGNVVGSNIFNVLFILGISALIVPLAVRAQLVRLDLPIMAAASILLFAVAVDGVIGRSEGSLMAGALVAYIWFQIRKGRSDPGVASGAPAPADGTIRRNTPRTVATEATWCVAGLVLLVVGARWFVSGAVNLAVALGVSDVVIGLTIIAAGTSLPEVATSVLASIRGERDIAAGNVVGSNIFNILGILGACGLIVPAGLAVDPSILAFDLPVMIAVALLALPVALSGMRISRVEGGLFLACYAAYTAFLILRATQQDALAVLVRVVSSVAGGDP